MTTQELKERLIKLGDEELRAVVEKDSADYTAEAIGVAKDELAARGVSYTEPSSLDPEGEAHDGEPRARDSRPTPRASDRAAPPLVGAILGGLGYLIIALGVLTAAMGFDKMSKATLIGWLASTVVSGLLFVGFSEIIKQLHLIATNTKR